MTTTITISDELFIDLKLIKRVRDSRTYEEVIRDLMNARGYDQKWLDYMNQILSEEGA